MKTLTLVFLLAVLNTNCLIHQYLSGQSIRISDVTKEHEAILTLHLWPGFQIDKIPVAIYDSTDTYLYFSEKAPEGFMPVENLSGVLYSAVSILRSGEIPLCKSMEDGQPPVS